MRVFIPYDKLEHLTEHSVYNSNYYRLPFKVNGWGILHQSYDGGDNFLYNALGVFINDKFEPMCYLNTDFEADGLVVFDSELINDNNLFT
jgi:hypothetical protein